MKKLIDGISWFKRKRDKPRPASVSRAANGPKIYSLEELREANLPRPTPIVEGLLNWGEVTLLAGRPKAGKSRLVQQLAICLSRGEDFLGHRISDPCRVLLLDLENKPAFTKQRFERMSESKETDKNIHIYCPEVLAEDSLTLADTKGLSRLRECITELESDVLIIDPWRLFSGGDELKAQDAVKALRLLSSLRKVRPNLGIIIVHHLRKNQGEGRVKLRSDPHIWAEEISGSYALVGHCDAIFGLEREREEQENELIVFGGIARNTAAPLTVLLEEDEESPLFWIARGEEVLKKLLTAGERKAWHVAKDLGTFGFNRLHEEDKKLNNRDNKKLISRMLARARKQGLVQQQADKSYRVLGSKNNLEEAA